MGYYPSITDMKTKPHVIRARAAHYSALETLNPGKPGIQIWRKLRRIESEAHDSTTAQCNGAAYAGQPFRPGWHPDGSEGTPENPTPWEIYHASVLARVAAVFGGTLPAGFLFNTDCRGYALKLDPERVTLPEGIHRDAGGYGILAPEIV